MDDTLGMSDETAACALRHITTYCNTLQVTSMHLLQLISMHSDMARLPHMRVCASVLVRVRVHARMRMCMCHAYALRVCLSICVYVCVYVCMHECVFVCVCVCVDTDIQLGNFRRLMCAYVYV